MPIIKTNTGVQIIVSGQGIPGPPGAGVAHGPTHSQNASDELKAEDLGTTGAVGSVPTSDGAGGLTMTVPSGSGNVASPGGETAGIVTKFTGSNTIGETLTTETELATAVTHSTTTTGNPHNLDATDVGAEPSGSISTHAADPDAHHSEAHNVASHSDTTTTGAQLNTLAGGGDASSLHTHSHGSTTGQGPDDHHSELHTVASHSDTTATGAELNQLTSAGDASGLHTHSHATITGKGPDDHHPQVHNVSSHSDTIASGAELNTLRAGPASDADSLHTHPALASPTISHAATTGQTADDHHNQQHGLGSSDHTSATIAEVNALVSDGNFDDAGDSRPPNGTATGDLNGTYPAPTVDGIQGQAVSAATPTEGQVLESIGGVWTPADPSGGGGGPGSDTTAIHDDTANEINPIPEKVSPGGSDVLIIEDNAAGGVKKRVQIGNLPTGGGGEANLIASIGTLGVPLVAAVPKSGVTLQTKHAAPASSQILVTADVNDNVLIDVNGNEIPIITKNSGFENKADSILSKVDGTRTFTIAPSVTDFTFWVQGQKFVANSAQNVVWPNTQGGHKFYFDAAGVLQTALGDVTGQDQRDFGLCATIYWDITSSSSKIFFEERHPFGQSPDTREYLHDTVASLWSDGLGLGIVSIDGSGDDEGNGHIIVGDGTFYDENNKVSIVDGAPQDLDPIAQIPVFYITGPQATPVLSRRATTTDFPFLNDGDAEWTGRVPFNEIVALNWTLTEATNNDYVLGHVFATPDVDTPIIAIQGQAEYTSLSLARDGATTELNNLVLIGVVSREMVPLGTFILETSNTHSNTPQARIMSALSGDYVDWRAAPRVGGGTGSVNEHNQLAGRSQLDNHTQYLDLGATRPITGDTDHSGNDITNVGLVDGVTVSSHQDRHLSGGADELDADTADIDYTPTNYTQNTTPPEVTTAAHLTAHLAGIDDVLAGVSGGDVVGPAGAVSGNICTYADGTGKLIDDSGTAEADIFLHTGARAMSDDLDIGGNEIQGGITLGGTLTDIGLFQYAGEVGSVGFFGDPLSPAIITAAGNDFDVATGVGAFHTGATLDSALGIGDWPASATNPIPLNSVRYVGVDWNAGTPQVVVKSTNSWDMIQEWPLGAVTRDADGVHPVISPPRLSSFAGLISQRLSETDSFARANGLNLSTLNLKIIRASGRGWLVTTPKDYVEFNSNVADTFERYLIGATNTVVDLNQTDFEDISFDNGTDTKGVINNNRFGVRWVYAHIDSGAISLIYGTSNTNDAAVALLEEPPATSALPPRFAVGTHLLGRIIFQRAAGVSLQVDDVWDTEFSTAAGGDGDVSGPAGGVASTELAVYADATGKALAGSGILAASVSLTGHTHSHSSTTGQTADDHHNQQHALGGSDHTSATLAELNALVSDAVLDSSSDARPPSAHTHLEADITDLDHTDPNAIHVTGTGQITGITEKVTAVGDDEFAMDDSENADNIRSVKVRRFVQPLLSLPVQDPHSVRTNCAPPLSYPRALLATRLNARLNLAPASGTYTFEVLFGPNPGSLTSLGFVSIVAPALSGTTDIADTAIPAGDVLIVDETNIGTFNGAATDVQKVVSVTVETELN